MTPVIVRSPEAAGRTRQGIAPAQPCATRDSAQIKFSSTRVACTASQKAGYRIRVGKRAGDRQRRFPLKSDPASSGKNLPASFQSAQASRAVTAGVLSVISAPLRLFQFFGAFTALRAVSPGLLRLVILMALATAPLAYLAWRVVG